MEKAEWYLHKIDDTKIYGPVTLTELQAWASDAKLSPMDKVSNDQQKSWVRAPMIPELQMDWLVEMKNDYLYGPTTVSTIQEFLANNEITEEDRVINARDGTNSLIKDLVFFKMTAHKAKKDDVHSKVDSYERENVSMSLQEKIGKLEALVLQLRNELTASEERYQKLMVNYRSLQQLDEMSNQPM